MRSSRPNFQPFPASGPLPCSQGLVSLLSSFAFKSRSVLLGLPLILARIGLLAHMLL